MLTNRKLIETLNKLVVVHGMARVYGVYNSLFNKTDSQKADYLVDYFSNK